MVMAEELELSDYMTIREPAGVKRTETTGGESYKSERRLLRLGILTFAALCIIQASLNISLRLAFHSKEDINQFPFNSSVIANLCKTEMMQQNSTQFCSCCNTLLKRLVAEYQALETEIGLLKNKIQQHDRDLTTDDDYGYSGSGIPVTHECPELSYY